jgi:hypothetical protein
MLFLCTPVLFHFRLFDDGSVGICGTSTFVASNILDGG